MAAACLTSNPRGVFPASLRHARPRFRVCSQKVPSDHETFQKRRVAEGAVGWVASGMASLSWLISAGSALAIDREYGILEGATLSLVHPAVMLGLLCVTGYAGWLGWQWRRLREIGLEIKELKKQLPAADAEGNVPASPIADEIATLEATRKQLAAGGFRDRHFNLGAVLLGGGVTTALYGCTNTYLRTGKLFPGPHLFAGAGIVSLWAVAASLVPSMQKGNETARSLHIALNAVNVILFLWQVPTGFEIVGKVLQAASFP